MEEDSTDNYRVKDIIFFGAPRRILLQSKNGPCPLLAICNVLLLRNVLKINPDTRYVTFMELVQMVSDWLFEANSKDSGGDSSRAANLRESLNSCLEVLPKLNVGLDVNCRFGGVVDFEYTQETTVFDMLDIALFHGWIIAEEDTRSHQVLGHLSYNQVVEKLIAYEELQQKVSDDGGQPSAETEKILEEGLLIKEFLDRTQTQISQEGLVALRQAVRERQLAVFFRNSHFNTMLKFDGQLYLLCTDIAFANSEVLWERFDKVDGDTDYVDAEFGAGQQAADAVGEVYVPGSMEDADAQLAWQMMQEDLRAQQEEEAFVQAQEAAWQEAQAAAKAQPRPKPNPKAKAAPAAATATAAASAATSSTEGGKKKKSGKSCVLQ
ncbi:mindy1 [Symbiodinium natans]|uniref:Mindy1 protein n=1 Tax=Symbiodinium natans TaxID=878477 RepID=A0A812SGN1_9DINO|nr:mindy1 [Symbiodinium natans]